MLKQNQMNTIRDEVFDLKKSSLYKERIQNNYVPVIGEGSLDAEIIFIGEAPGKNEALTGKPFCGASGKVLDELLSYIKLQRENVYVTNIVKDRPTQNRDPEPQEIDLYVPYLIRQIEIIKPKIIATLGRFSMEFILKHYGLESSLDTISKLHGNIFRINTNWGEVIIVPLYHPAVAVYNRTQLDVLKGDMSKLKKILNK